METSLVIHASALVKRYGPLTAVDGVDFDVRAGECLGLLGPNGAGKSSVIKMVSCVSPVTEGTLTVGGLAVQEHPRRVKSFIGVVPQEDNLDPDFPVLRNLEVYARYYGIPLDVARPRALEGLELMQLMDKRDARIDTLSGGMKRRLLIARALMNDPLLLILDEPTTGLDPQARHMVWNKLFLLKRQGVNILLTTHYMEEAAFLSDRVIVMDHGRVQAEGTPERLVEQHAGHEVLEVRPRPGRYDAIRAQLQAMELDIQESPDALYVFAGDDHRLSREMEMEGADLLWRRANLEDTFLRLTGRELREG